MVRDEFRTEHNLRIWQLNDNFRKVWELDPVSGAVYEYREETFKQYQSEFETAVVDTAKALGIDTESLDEAEVESIAHVCLEDDYSYRGLDDAWVDVSTVTRCLKDASENSYSNLVEGCGKKNKLLKAMIKASKGGAK